MLNFASSQSEKEPRLGKKRTIAKQNRARQCKCYQTTLNTDVRYKGCKIDINLFAVCARLLDLHGKHDGLK